MTNPIQITVQSSPVNIDVGLLSNLTTAGDVVYSSVDGLADATQVTNLVAMLQADYDNRAILPWDAFTLFVVPEGDVTLPPGGGSGVAWPGSAVLSVTYGLAGASRITKVVGMPSQESYEARAILADDATTLFITPEAP